MARRRVGGGAAVGETKKKGLEAPGSPLTVRASSSRMLLLKSRIFCPGCPAEI
jgi:hypothetical protein